MSLSPSNRKEQTNEIKEYKRTPEEEEQLRQKLGGRFSEGKLRYDLIPRYPIQELAKVYLYGSKKYNDDNWRKGLKWRKDVIGPLQRHLEKWLRGELIDEESGCLHLAMALWNTIALMEFERCNLGIDDRNPYDLDLMDEEEQIRRITLWLKHVAENTMHEYDGLKK